VESNISCNQFEEIERKNVRGSITAADWKNGAGGRYGLRFIEAVEAV
jgi:hypothetical protein